MLNLFLSSCSVLPPDLLLADCKAASLDCNTEKLWVVSDDSVLRFVEVDGANFKVNSASDLIGSGLITADDKVIGIECLPEMNLVAIATKKGELLSCNSISLEVEGVGSVSNGFLCMSWSPDQDLVVMVTGSRNLLLMTREFDPLTEVSVDTNEFGEAQPVTVGWGKKETQFHGSLGKQHAQQQIMTKPLTPAGPHDDHTPRVSWRGDGEYFACSTIDPSTGARVFRVWTREGTLHSTGDPTDGLEHPLSWRPSGSLIACCQKKPHHQYDIIFFERNGLKHGEFSLPESHSEWTVQELLWNADSTVLGVWLERLPGSLPDNTASTTSIQLWTTKNYHWYLKQELHPLATDHTHSAVSAIIWDPIVPLKLHLITSSGQYIIYTWQVGVSSSGYLNASNKGGVAVIDGAGLLWTPFRQVSIPPPMCAHKLTFTVPVLSVAFAPPPHSNDFLALLSNGTVSVVKVDEVQDSTVTNDTFKRVTTHPPCVASTLSFLGDLHFNIHDLRQLVWIQEDTLLGVASHGQSCDKSCDLYRDFIVEYTISDTTLKEKSRFQCDGQVLCFHGNHNISTVVVEFQDGSVYQYKDSSLDPWITESGDHVTFGGLACDQIALTTFKNKEHVVGLHTKRHQLFVDNLMVSSDCTSFTVHDEFVLMTTDSHYLKVLPRHCSPSPLTSPELQTDEVAASADESIRRVERGAWLVIAIPSDFKVILQMPRGNLETVCPRALVLTRVRRCIDSLQYKEAFLIMRKHRLNLNFLCDHNLESFISNVDQFVKQVADVTFINLFLTELKSDDVTQTMYPTPFWYGKQPLLDRPHTHVNKVNLICDTLLRIFYDLGEQRYMLCIITAHVKKSPPEVEIVLKKLQWLKDEAPPNTEVGGVSAEDALKYMILLVDVNELYNIALGMYDFALVIMVAEKSQKDPKEYLPFLNELKKLPEMYCRYKIDRYLKRYEKALANISQCGSERFEEGLSLIKEQKLYKQALKLYRTVGSHEHHVISVLYAEHLVENGCHKEAGIVYEGCGELERSLSSYDKADLWRHVFIVSAQAGHSEERRQEIAKRMAAKLETLGRHVEAATVWLEYLGDTVEAVKVLIEGKEWAESLRLIHLHGHLEMIEELLKPALLEAQQSQVLFIEGQLLTFNRHFCRLEVVRQEKAARTRALLDGSLAVDERDVELFSDISSVTGLSSIGSSKISRVSNKTAKSRKKAERKKYSLKEGSVHEDIALTEALKEIIESTNGVEGETGSLLLMLSIFQFESEAKELQEAFTVLRRTVQKHYREIWPPAESMEQNNSVVTGPSATVGAIVGSLKPYQTTLNAVSAPQMKKDERWKLTTL